MLCSTWIRGHPFYRWCLRLSDQIFNWLGRYSNQLRIGSNLYPTKKPKGERVDAYIGALTISHTHTRGGVKKPVPPPSLGQPIWERVSGILNSIDLIYIRLNSNPIWTWFESNSNRLSIPIWLGFKSKSNLNF